MFCAGDHLVRGTWLIHRHYMKLMRLAMEVLCVSSLTYFSQPNNWRLAAEFSKLLFAFQTDSKTSPDHQTASTWLLQDLCSAFNTVLNSGVDFSPEADPSSLLTELDKLLTSVKHKTRTGLDGEQLALINSHLIRSFVHRLLVECLIDLKHAGINTFGQFDTLEQELK